MSVAQFMDHVRSSDLDAVKRALGCTPAVLQGRGAEQRTALHLAAAEGDANMLRLLLQHGADVAAMDAAGEVPLIVAARQGHLAVVRELLAGPGRRGLLRSMSKDGSTALHAAAAAGQGEVVSLLLEVGAPMDVRDRAGRTPLDLAPSGLM
ncbi:MAG: hypothetical protein J3K34DRAFT_159942, partial [Monoraphidium minutum]